MPFPDFPNGIATNNRIQTPQITEFSQIPLVVMMWVAAISSPHVNKPFIIFIVLIGFISE